jgi:hypothetical protein
VSWPPVSDSGRAPSTEYAQAYERAAFASAALTYFPVSVSVSPWTNIPPFVNTRPALPVTVKPTCGGITAGGLVTVIVRFSTIGGPPQKGLICSVTVYVPAAGSTTDCRQSSIFVNVSPGVDQTTSLQAGCMLPAGGFGTAFRYTVCPVLPDAPVRGGSFIDRSYSVEVRPHTGVATVMWS